MLACAKLGATMQGLDLHMHSGCYYYDMFQVFYHPSSKNTNIHCIYGRSHILLVIIIHK